MKNVALHNLGCKVNSYEIEVMQQMLQEKGYNIVPFDEVRIFILSTPVRLQILQTERAARCFTGQSS